MPEKVEFVSPAWIRLARRELSNLVKDAGEAIAGQTFSVCEVFVDPPAHLCKNGEREVVYSFVIADGNATVTQDASRKVDLKAHTDYQTALLSARSVYETTPGEIERRSRARREAAAAGQVTYEGDPEAHLRAISPAMRALLTEMHNRMALKTA